MRKKYVIELDMDKPIKLDANTYYRIIGTKSFVTKDELEKLISYDEKSYIEGYKDGLYEGLKKLLND